AVGEIDRARARCAARTPLAHLARCEERLRLGRALVASHQRGARHQGYLPHPQPGSLICTCVARTTLKHARARQSRVGGDPRADRAMNQSAGAALTRAQLRLSKGALAMAESTPPRNQAGSTTHEIKQRATDQFERMADNATEQFRNVAEQAEQLANRATEQ